MVISNLWNCASEVRLAYAANLEETATQTLVVGWLMHKYGATGHGATSGCVAVVIRMGTARRCWLSRVLENVRKPFGTKSRGGER